MFGLEDNPILHALVQEGLHTRAIHAIRLSSTMFVKARTDQCEGLSKCRHVAMSARVVLNATIGLEVEDLKPSCFGIATNFHVNMRANMPPLITPAASGRLSRSSYSQAGAVAARKEITSE